MRHYPFFQAFGAKSPPGRYQPVHPIGQGINLIAQIIVPRRYGLLRSEYLLPGGAEYLEDLVACGFRKKAEVQGVTCGIGVEIGHYRI